MSSELPDEFGAQVSRALVVFQFIEENLKLYIKYSFKLIRVKLDQDIPFRFDGSEYQNAPLERLITVFEKLTDNTDLVKSLNKLKNDRNYVAHYALVSYHKGPRDGSHHDQEIKRINEIAGAAWVCFILLQTDLAALNDRIMGPKA